LDCSTDPSGLLGRTSTTDLDALGGRPFYRAVLSVNLIIFHANFAKHVTRDKHPPQFVGTFARNGSIEHNSAAIGPNRNDTPTIHDASFDSRNTIRLRVHGISKFPDLIEQFACRRIVPSTLQ